MRNFWAIPQNGAKKPDGANRPVRCVVFMGSFRRVAPVARSSLHRPRCAAPVVPHPPGWRACRFRLPSPLRRIRRAGEHAGSASPLRFPSPLRRPVALFPLSPRCAPPVGPEITPLPCAIPPPLGCSLRVAFVASCCAAPCRAAALIAWRPAPDRSAGPRCRAPCGRCPPQSPTR